MIALLVIFCIVSYATILYSMLKMSADNQQDYEEEDEDDN